MQKANYQIVIVGGGFGGLSAAQILKYSKHEITLVDKTNHHLFQPLLYQVATAALSPADIAMPIRSIFTNYSNVKVILDEITSVDVEKNVVHLSNSEMLFDYLILAPGTRHSYFGKSEWEKKAPGLKTLSDALLIREKILLSLEEAEKIGKTSEAEKYLTFIIIGGGPTGVELAGAIAEIAKQTMIRDFRNIDMDKTKIILIEGSNRILMSYSPTISERAKFQLEKLGVEVLLNHFVEEVGNDFVILGDKKIYANSIIWAAGNEAPSLLKSLNTKMDKAGRVVVNDDCSIPNHNNIFVIGDSCIMNNRKGHQLPAVAPVAIQQGKYVANVILNDFKNKKRKPFNYMDRGNLATIGKAKAVADIRGIEFSGFLAWLLWSFIHILFLIGYRNRFRVMAEWIWDYITKQRGIRLIVGRPKLE